MSCLYCFQGWKNHDFFENQRNQSFYLNHIFYLSQIFVDFLEIRIFAPRFYQIFETGLSAQSHKLHGRRASAVSDYTLAEQKVS